MNDCTYFKSNFDAGTAKSITSILNLLLGRHNTVSKFNWGESTKIWLIETLFYVIIFLNNNKNKKLKEPKIL